MANGPPRSAENTLQTMADRGDLRPIPDPTVLTTQAQKASIDALREILDMRFAGMDKAQELLQDALNKYPDFVNAVVKQLQLLHEEKFASIANQFTLRDVAVAAALKAAQEAVFAQQIANKEANNKMESAFEKRIEQLGSRLDLMSQGLKDNIEDLKVNFGRMESSKSGGTEQRKAGIENLTIFISVLALIASIIMVVLFSVMHHA